MNAAIFLALLEKKKSIFGIFDSDLARVIGVSPKTFSRRVKDPETFTLGEVKTLIRFLRFTEDERKEALL